MFSTRSSRCSIAMRQNRSIVMLMMAGLLGSAGCRTGGAHTPDGTHAIGRIPSTLAEPPARAVYLAAMSQVSDTRPAGGAASTRPAELGGLTSRPAGQAGDTPATQPATSAARYTAPSMGFRQLDILATGVALAGLPVVSDQGRNASQAAVAAVGVRTEGVIGRAGLSTSQSTVAGSVLTRDGLQRGFGTGLGFASPRFSVLRAAANPASGPNGRLAELMAAGFNNLPSSRR